MLITVLIGSIRSHADIITYNFSSGPLTAGVTSFGAKAIGDGSIEGETTWVAGYDQTFAGSFNPQLGKLNSVTFTMDSSVTVNGYGYYSQQPIPVYPGTGFLDHGFTSQLQLKNGNDNMSLLSQAGGGAGASINVISNGGNVPYSFTYAGTASAVFTDPSILLQFENTVLSVENDMSDYWRTYFASDFEAPPTAQINYSFTYDFTPVPEPNILCLLSLGATVVFWRRKFS